MEAEQSSAEISETGQSVQLEDVSLGEQEIQEEQKNTTSSKFETESENLSNFDNDNEVNIPDQQIEDIQSDLSEHESVKSTYIKSDLKSWFNKPYIGGNFA